MILKDVFNLGKESLFLGGFSQGLAGLPPGTIRASGQQALSNVARFQPARGTILGSALVFRSLKKLKVKL